MIKTAPYAARHADGVPGRLLPIPQQEFGIPVTQERQPDLRDMPGYHRAL